MFCGIGGFRLGLERASPEFETVWANDIDRYACQVYRKHWDDGVLHEGDIRQVVATEIPDHDLLTAGFPCQSFSVAGKRKGLQDDRGTMFFEVVRVAAAKRPPLLLLENVKGLLFNDGGRTFAHILHKLGNLGYWLEWQVLNSKRFGVPQNRERVFVVGHLGGEGSEAVFPLEEGFALSDQTNHGERGEEEVQAEVFSAVDTRTGALRCGGEPYIVDIFNQSARRDQHAAGALKAEGVSKTSLGTAVMVHALYPRTGDPRQGGVGQISRVNESFALDAHNSMAVQVVANCVDSTGWLREMGRHEVGRHGLTDYRIRRLTPTECERLQGFPDGWTEGVSDTQRYKLLGNAVTTNVIESLGQRILEKVRS